MNHYLAAVDLLSRSYEDGIDDGTALWRATCAQAQATLAVVDALNELIKQGEPEIVQIRTAGEKP